MVDTEHIRTGVGILGNIISLCLFLSPIPAMITIIKKKSTLEFLADPYVATLLNCMMWLFYGMPFVHPDSLLVITINGAGLAIEAIYISIFLVFATAKYKMKIILYLIIEVVFMAIVVFVTMFFFKTTKDRSMIVGILCVVFNIGMYTAPLTIMKKVIQTKSVKYMPFSLSVANLVNGIVWVIYSLLKFDVYILIPNGLGAISGVIQVVLYGIYYKTTNWDEEDDNKGKSEVQMSGA